MSELKIRKPEATVIVVEIKRDGTIARRTASKRRSAVRLTAAKKK